MRLIVESGDVLNVREAYKYLGIGQATLFRWLKSGKLKAVRLDHRTLFLRSELELFKSRLK